MRLQAAEVPLHLFQQQLQFASRHVEFLLSFFALLGLLLGLELRPQSLEGGLLSLPAPQLILQTLQNKKQSESVHPSKRGNTRQCWIQSAYCERVAVLLEGCAGCVWVMDVHCEASALCVGQPQQQGVEGFMELLYGGWRLVLMVMMPNRICRIPTLLYYNITPK